MSSAPTDPPAVARDDQLAQLLAEITESARQGQNPDVEAIAREHPEARRRAARALADRTGRRGTGPDGGKRCHG